MPQPPGCYSKSCINIVVASVLCFQQWFSCVGNHVITSSWRSIAPANGMKRMAGLGKVMYRPHRGNTSYFGRVQYHRLLVGGGVAKSMAIFMFAEIYFCGSWCDEIEPWSFVEVTNFLLDNHSAGDIPCSIRSHQPTRRGPWVRHPAHPFFQDKSTVNSRLSCTP